jgi:hypothetical protein
MRKVCDVLTKKQSRDNENTRITSDRTSTPQIERDNSSVNRLFDNTQGNQNDLNERIRYTNNDNQHPLTYSNPNQLTHTIIVPPAASIPTFSGSIAESPRQFLIRVREYAETINRWNEQSLLNGISQFLKDTALEWYC